MGVKKSNSNVFTLFLNCSGTLFKFSNLILGLILSSNNFGSSSVLTFTKYILNFIDSNSDILFSLNFNFFWCSNNNFFCRISPYGSCSFLPSLLNQVLSDSFLFFSSTIFSKIFSVSLASGKGPVSSLISSLFSICILFSSLTLFVRLFSLSDLSDLFIFSFLGLLSSLLLLLELPPQSLLFLFPPQSLLLLLLGHSLLSLFSNKSFFNFSLFLSLLLFKPSSSLPISLCLLGVLMSIISLLSSSFKESFALSLSFSLLESFGDSLFLSSSFLLKGLYLACSWKLTSFKTIEGLETLLSGLGKVSLSLFSSLVLLSLCIKIK